MKNKGIQERGSKLFQVRQPVVLEPGLDFSSIFPPYIIVVTYGCESWTTKKAEHQKNWCFRTVVLEKTLESSLDYKEIKPVNPKGNQPWRFTGKTDAETEAPVWPPDVKD